jgi:hypothetical protein
MERKSCEQCGQVYFSAYARSTRCYPCFSGRDSHAVQATRALQGWATNLERKVVHLEFQMRAMEHTIHSLRSDARTKTGKMPGGDHKKILRQVHPDRTAALLKDEEKLRSVLTMAFTHINGNS